MQDTLTISSALRTGWEKLKPKFWLVFGSIAVAQLLMSAPSLISQLSDLYFTKGGTTTPEGYMSLVSILIVIVMVVLGYYLQVLLGIGLLRIQLNVIDGKDVEFAQLFHSEGKFWTFLWGMILYGLIVLGGLLLLIVPGIIFAIKYQFITALIVDKKITASEALSESGRITQGHKGWLFGFAIVLGLVNLATIFTLFLGLVITVPLTALAYIQVYRVLSKSSVESSKSKAEPAKISAKKSAKK